MRKLGYICYIYLTPESLIQHTQGIIKLLDVCLNSDNTITLRVIGRSEIGKRNYSLHNQREVSAAITHQFIVGVKNITWYLQVATFLSGEQVFAGMCLPCKQRHYTNNMDDLKYFIASHWC